MRMSSLMKKSATIYLDLDGVFSDFVTRAYEVYPDFGSIHGVYHDMISTTHQKEWRDGMILAILRTPFFWANLDMCSGAEELIAFITDNFDSEQCAILTAPISEDLYRCTTQKRAWVEDKFGSLIDPDENFFVSHNKADYVGKISPENYQILIDDRVDNIQKWVNHGGIGILHDSKNWMRTIEQLKDYINN